MSPYQLYNNLDTHSLYRERLYGCTFKSLLTITYTTLPARKCTAYTTALATYQLRSYTESLNALDITLIKRQLTT